MKKVVIVMLLSIIIGKVFSKPIEEEKLIYLLKHDCGSCHGMTFKGGLGPSLLQEDLSKRSSLYLFSIIKYGKPMLAMPGWKNQLTDDEIKWIVSHLTKRNNE